MLQFNPLWKGICIDAIQLIPNEQKYELFKEGDDPRSNLELTENQIVDIIFQNESFLELILECSGVSNYSNALKHVPKGDLVLGDQGDFDLAIYGPTYPFQIACYEFKRVKIQAIDFKEDKINKITGISGLAKQLENRVKLGFSTVFGVLILHSDLRHRKTANTITRYYSEETLGEILLKIDKEKDFPDEAGLLLVRFDQPTGNPMALNFYVALLKRGHFMKQSEKVTNYFSDYLNAYSG